MSQACYEGVAGIIGGRSVRTKGHTITAASVFVQQRTANGRLIERPDTEGVAAYKSSVVDYSARLQIVECIMAAISRIRSSEFLSFKTSTQCMKDE